MNKRFLLALIIFNVFLFSVVYAQNYCDILPKSSSDQKVVIKGGRLEVGGNTSNGLSLNVTNDLFVNDTSGFVGIGTTNPVTTLHVAGGWLRVGNSGSKEGIQLEPQGTFHRIAFHELRFYDWDNSVDMVTFNNNNIGIGTTNPGSKLEIAGNEPQLRLRLNNTNNVSDFWSDPYGRLGIQPGINDNLILLGSPNTDPVRLTFTRYDGTNWHESYIGYFDTTNQLQLYSNGGQVQIPVDSLYVGGNYVWLAGKNFVLQGTNGEWSFDFPDGDGNDFWQVWDPVHNTILSVRNNGNVGVGIYTPKTKLQVSGGDIYVQGLESGVILRSPNGNCFRLTVRNTGELKTTGITCP